MNLLNFSHPLTDIQQRQITERIGRELSLVQTVPVQLAVEQDFAPQVSELVDRLEIESARWQNETWLIVLPSLNFGAAVLLSDLRARMGHFPTIIRLKPVQQNFTTQYEVAEIIDLEQVRQEARKKR